ncbi:hypothetical protein [Lentibacillus amyloliquefaciens]|nr:hypothetical protein [Lentibacillus amyloliquefaciens]
MIGLINRHKNHITAITGRLLVLAPIFHFMNWQASQTGTLFAATFLAGIPIFIKTFQAHRMKAFSIELLVTIAVIGALFIGEYVESAVVTFQFMFGGYLEIRTLKQNTLIFYMELINNYYKKHETPTEAL